MKGTILVVVLLLAVACNMEPKKDLATDKGKLSYAIGQEIGGNFKNQGMDIDPSTLAASIADVMAGRKSALSEDELKKVQTSFQQKQMDKMKASSEKGKVVGEQFLEKNRSQDGWKATSSGLQFKVVTEGKGPQPKETDTVTVDYAGKLVDGTEFDSSYKRGQPAEFPVNGVIPGWTEALKLMHVGDKYQLAIPYQLAYGEQGRPPVIPPYSVLLFDVELKGIKKGHATAKK